MMKMSEWLGVMLGGSLPADKVYTLGNTTIRNGGDVYLHGNRIYEHTGPSITLAGYETKTTVNRLNQIMVAVGLQCRLFRVGGKVWRVCPAHDTAMRMEPDKWYSAW